MWGVGWDCNVEGPHPEPRRLIAPRCRTPIRAIGYQHLCCHCVGDVPQRLRCLSLDDDRRSCGVGLTGSPVPLPGQRCGRGQCRSRNHEGESEIGRRPVSAEVRDRWFFHTAASPSADGR